MQLECLGEVMNVDPAQASLDESIVRGLRRWGPSSQRDLWYRSKAQRGTREQFQTALDRLVARGVIVREATNRINRFIYRMSPPRRSLKQEAL